ncbi:MAG: hypothetical protein MUP16_11285 [Sedimentisphaerales bacterium]|nr:hypothetical protein [Sedimentisphaerales bacterium]
MKKSRIESRTNPPSVWRIKVFALALLAASFCVAVSCKKSPQPSGKQNVASNQGKQAKPSAQKQETAPPAPDNSGTKDEGRRTKDETKLEPIVIELPKPMFVGTPQPARVLNLEKPLGKARAPFLAPVGTKNVARGKKVTSSDEMPIIGELSYITDGDKEAADGSYVELGPFKQYVTIDLGAKHEIYAVVVWHYHKQALVYFDVVVQISDDSDFISDVKTIFNNDIDNSSGLGVGKDMHYVETNEGKLIDAKGVHGRYVRLYSNGSNANDLNHYIEVEVYGKPGE